MTQINSEQLFFNILKAGLWETNVQLDPYFIVDFNNLLQMAREQSVVGLFAAGLEHITDVKIPQILALTIAGDVLKIEQRNKAMNQLISDLIAKMRNLDIYTLIVKGQGVAQCYERPFWRACGDVDFYMSEDNFLKAREFFRPQVTNITPDNDKVRRIEMNYGSWVIELHANQYISTSIKANYVLEEIHHDLFYGGNVRSWNNNGTTVFLPSPDDDVIIIFTHFFNHFYKGGVGLRQICDWCRLLYTYRDTLNQRLLESRIRKMGLMTEWKAFATFVVDYLGMPTEAMPFYSSDIKWKMKANRICTFILEVGNFGHNRDNSYYNKYPYMIRKAMSFGRRCSDLLSHARIFPMDSLRFFSSIAFYGVRSALRGE